MSFDVRILTALAVTDVSNTQSGMVLSQNVVGRDTVREKERRTGSVINCNRERKEEGT